MNHTTTHRAALGTQPSDHVAEELHCYDKHLRDVNGLAAGTRQSRIRVADRLLRQKFKGRAIDIAKLRPDDVRLFLASQLDARRTASNASCLAAGLRSYFRYRTTCGDRVGGLIAVISNPVHWRLASLPHALKPDEVERLLNSFTSARRWPKRGYAIVRCALDMGLSFANLAPISASVGNGRRPETGHAVPNSTEEVCSQLRPQVTDGLFCGVMPAMELAQAAAS